MNGVNLMPVYRRQAQRRLARVRLWSGIAAFVATGVLIAEGALWSAWRSGGHDIVAESEKLAKEITEGERLVAAGKEGIRQLVQKAEADTEVSDQPDWGLLLSLVAAKLGPDAALEVCRLEPGKPQPEAKPTKATEKARSKPARLLLTLDGVARTQDAASRVALALKELGLFEGVSLTESRRTVFMAREAVAFHIECAIADAGPPGVTGGEP